MLGCNVFCLGIQPPLEGHDSTGAVQQLRNGIVPTHIPIAVGVETVWEYCQLSFGHNSGCTKAWS